ncbi:MAG TPA: thioredoxin domain-containing protein [Rhizomicrobium sp.]|nr:thioredoxin domain-containing protein [Rhizomicrobium sp.]
MSSNRLGTASSPYLRLHKDDPVHWHPWGREALAEAEAQNKPILLSIGYTTCYWCHVMGGQSFADPETAAIMNEHFVNVLVDREERPDIDLLYQNASAGMGARGGWPLTMFLTPKGVPFFAGAFFPKEKDSTGLPTFKTVLGDVSKLYRDNPAPVAEATERVLKQMSEHWSRDTRGTLDGMTLETVAVRVAQRFDIFFGGVTGTQKFPSVPLTELLWRAYLRTGASQYMQLMSTTLDHMLIAGMYDHVGGGFFRYATDERWLAPHFEKMGNDNAQILGLMTSVWQHNHNAICEARINETVDWLLREMMAGDAFATAIDAQVDGFEGRYYLWSEAEIDAVLAGTFVQKFKAAYGVTRDGNLAGRNHLHRLGTQAPFPQPEADEALLKRQRQMLLEARSKRKAPARDEKVLADTNGMIVTALAEAGFAFAKPDWIAKAVKAFDFVVKALGDGGRLSHSWIDGMRGHDGFADDYAHMARAALALWEVTGEQRFLDHAQRWVLTLNEHFWDGIMGGYYTTAEDSDPLVVRTRSIYDQNQPPANAVMIGVLARLYMATGEIVYNERCFSLVRGLANEGLRVFMSMGSYFDNVEFAASNLQIVIVGPKDSLKTRELVDAVRGRSLPNKLLTVIAPDQTLPEGHPARGKEMANGQPTAYVCQRNACSAPVTNAVALSQMLQLPQPRQAPPAARAQ